MDKIIKALLESNPFYGNIVRYAPLANGVVAVELTGGYWRYAACFLQSSCQFRHPGIRWPCHKPEATEKLRGKYHIEVLPGSSISDSEHTFGSIANLAKQTLQLADDASWYDEPEVVELETDPKKGRLFSGDAIRPIAARLEANTPTTTKHT